MARRRPTAYVAHPAQNALFAMTDLPTPAAPRRLFTALFPPPEACAAIDAERQRWPGLPRRLHPVLGRMHLTLQFFNAVDAPHERDRLPRCRRCASTRSRSRSRKPNCGARPAA